ncbi:MAG: thiamine-phosphate pyrophosphorylase [Candidatus Omnitrophota bacterium]|nr:thiamine-phosphate pyrophosphorylase [Candidatus Omnitrophota bacterium]
MNSRIYRIIDANLNRSREGLRVCEEITRFILNDSKLTSRFKNYRHLLSHLSQNLPLTAEQLLKSRDSRRDVGNYAFRPKKRKNEVREIFTANIRRSEEALRVLEEFSKTINKKTAVDFQQLRFKLYTLEQRTLLKIISTEKAKEL